MPPHDKHHKHHRKHDKHHRHVPASRALSFVDERALDGVLAALVPDATERAFVARCLVEEGPLHHRGANYLLVTLVARLLALVPGDDAVGDGVRVPMRLPPHLEDEVEDGDFPLRLPTTALGAMAEDEDDLEAMVDCLTDGPPQHALANVVLVALLERLLRRLEAKR